MFQFYQNGFIFLNVYFGHLEKHNLLPQFLVPLKKDTVLSWEMAESLFARAQTGTDVDYRFGVASGIDIAPYAELRELAQRFNLKDRIFIIDMPTSMAQLPVHIDGHPDKNNAASVIWPIYGCDERSPTRWFSTKSHEFEFVRNSYFLKSAEDLRECHSQAMVSARRAPYLLRSDVLHTGTNNSGSRRVLVKWELNFHDWEEAYSQFQSRDLVD